MAEMNKVQVTCEKCGKQNQVDTASLAAGDAPCAECGEKLSLDAATPLPSPAEEPAGEQARPARRAADEGAKKTVGKARVMGLRGKMAILFLVVPIVLMSVAGIFYMSQLSKMVDVFTQASSEMVARLSGEMLAQASRQTAIQVKRYLEDNPFLKKEDFNRDQGLKLLAVQKIGMTGFTAVYSLPDAGGVWRMWAHVDPDIVGIDLADLKKEYGTGFEDYWRILTAVKNGKSARGVYSWKDSEGVTHASFIVCTPIEGTQFAVMASVPAVEFTRDVKRLQTKTGKVASRTRWVITIILLVTLILIGVIVAFFGARISGKLKELTSAADSISMGDMDTQITVKSNDEIGDLADAIGRMQESIRLSIERLRRRRNR
ncbi:MAG: HAMP domain-containing protein [Thermodesulfobacteriota bacterium]